MWLGALSSAVPCFYVSWVLINVWRDPLSWDNGNWVRIGVGLLLLEFVLLHSGAFMSAIITIKQPFRNKLMLGLGLLLFYGLMVVGFSVSLDSTALLWVFSGVMLGRMLTALTNASAGAQAMMAHSALGVVLYLFVVMGTIFIPVPEWGITSRVLAEVYPDRGSGVWELYPQRAIAGAALYFLLLGLAELFLLGPANFQAANQRMENVKHDAN